MQQEDLSPHLQNLSNIILLAFALIAATLVFWGVVRTGILSREDNPRLVEAELRIQRGTIWDRNGTILAETIGQSDNLTRNYPIPNIGPAVVYYSFRHGTAGVEESFDTLLRGDTADFWTDFVRQGLHEPQIGQDVRLTLDAQLQETAHSLLGSQTGAILLLNLPGAEILALVSHPGYDPNQLDELFDELSKDERAPLLNRVTQGQYQPGLVLQPLILAAALDGNLINLTDTVANVNRPISINGTVTRCLSRPPQPATWLDVLSHRCPGPMMDLADQLGLSGLDQILTGFGLTTPPSLPLNTEMPDSEPMADPLLAAIGQENLTVTPLQIGLVWAALGTDGRLPIPRLVTAVQDEKGDWQEVVNKGGERATAVSATSARSLRLNLPQHENILEHTVLVLSGPEGSMNGWYLGLAPATSPRYAVVVVVEGSTDSSVVEDVGREMLQVAFK